MYVKFQRGLKSIPRLGNTFETFKAAFTFAADTHPRALQFHPFDLKITTRAIIHHAIFNSIWYGAWAAKQAKNKQQGAKQTRSLLYIHFLYLPFFLKHNNFKLLLQASLFL